MGTILLTGAGFSYNWGGYLAKEAFDYLLGVTETDDDLRRLLWTHQAKGWGFETTLAVLRKEYEENYNPQVEQDYRNMTGLKLFIIDPGGLGVLDGAPKIAGHALLDDLRDAIEGGSRRPFPASVTTDEIERRKIQRFFPLFG